MSFLKQTIFVRVTLASAEVAKNTPSARKYSNDQIKAENDHDLMSILNIFQKIAN